MSLTTKNHLNIVIQAFKTLLSFKADKSELKDLDKNLTNTGIKLIEEFCSVFETITVGTDKLYDAQRMCDRLLDELGVVISVIGNDDLLGCNAIININKDIFQLLFPYQNC